MTQRLQVAPGGPGDAADTDATRDWPVQLAQGQPGAPPAGGAAPRPGWHPIVIVPAHGGAGASTLAQLLRRELATDPAGRGWRVDTEPAFPDGNPGQIAAASWLRVPPPGMPVIIAARGTAEGARRAVIAVTALEYRGIRAAAIVMTADGAGPEPRQAVQRLDLIAGRAGPVIRVPFTAALRAGGEPGAIRLPRRLHAAVTRILAAAMTQPARAGRAGRP